MVNNHDNCRRQSLQGRCSPAEQPVLARQTAHSTCQDGPFGGLTAPVAQCTVAQRVAPNARHGNTILQNVAPAKPSGAMQPRARGGIKQRQGHRKTIALPQQVGMTGLEPATSRPPDACANQLRYIPSLLAGAKVHTYYDICKLLGVFLHLQRKYLLNTHILKRPKASSDS